MCSVDKALRIVDKDIRLVSGNADNMKWLIYDCGYWIVREHKKYTRNTKTLISTNSMKKAVDKLIE